MEMNYLRNDSSVHKNVYFPKAYGDRPIGSKHDTDGYTDSDDRPSAIGIGITFAVLVSLFLLFFLFLDLRKPFNRIAARFCPGYVSRKDSYQSVHSYLSFGSDSLNGDVPRRLSTFQTIERRVSEFVGIKEGDRPSNRRYSKITDDSLVDSKMQMKQEKRRFSCNV
ncbi:unnamed protein product [Owenia fusiformis]|uniref:Uncharacterized protein n=1 Tax=Owenia fusiformis TaxID=6347 RepID=A0A8S4MXF9_OWEFU|nr:unnamed protein product [Owenia fusiformis]